MRKIVLLSINIMLMVVTLTLASCSSNEDKLVGSWSDVFGLSKCSYTSDRTYRTDGPGSAMIEIFTFTKGENGAKGSFIDKISPVSNKGVVIGSTVSGEWEIKDKKLYLYFDDLSLTGTVDNISEEMQQDLEIEMLEKLGRFEEVGKEGIPYEIVEKNGKIGLKIGFPGGKLVLKRDKNN